VRLDFPCQELTFEDFKRTSGFALTAECQTVNDGSTMKHGQLGATFVQALVGSMFAMAVQT